MCKGGSESSTLIIIIKMSILLSRVSPPKESQCVNHPLLHCRSLGPSTGVSDTEGVWGLNLPRLLVQGCKTSSVLPKGGIHLWCPQGFSSGLRPLGPFTLQSLAESRCLVCVIALQLLPDGTTRLVPPHKSSLQRINFYFPP